MAIEMSQSEIDTLFKDMGTGVLSLTNDAKTYAVPQSLGYDGERLYSNSSLVKTARKWHLLKRQRLLR